MSWKLESDQGQIEVSQTRVFGRDDFGGHASLSRKHFELVFQDEKVHLKDVGSTNGTLFRGKKLAANQAVEIESGESFKAGDLKFTLEQITFRYQRAYGPIWGTALLVLFLIALNGPGMDHGKSIGVWNLFTLFTLVGTSVAAVGGAIWYFSPLADWTKQRLALSCALLFVGSLALNQVVFRAADSLMAFHEGVADARIDYYCTTHFSAPHCVNEIYICPACVAKLSLQERKGISVRIQPYIQAAAAAEKNRQPASPRLGPPKSGH